MSDLSDVPQAAPAELALTPVADAVTTALAEVSKTHETITGHLQYARELAVRYQNVVYDARTSAGLDAMRKIRADFRDNARYPIQELQKAGSKILGQMQRQFNTRAHEIIEEVKELERPWDEMIVAEETRKETEKAERDAAEQRRKDAHLQAIAVIQRMPADAVGLELGELEAVLAAARELVIDDSYEEFEGAALQAKDEAVRVLNGMLVAARADELERTELAAAQARMAAAAAAAAERTQAAEAEAAAQREKTAAAEREAAELHAKLAAMEAKEAAEKAERERAAAARAAAIEGRIQALRTYGGDLEQYGSAALEIMVEGMQSERVHADDYGDRAEEAREVRNARALLLAQARDAAIEREAAEAARQRAATIQGLIDVMREMGEKAELAVQDGSADVEQLRAGLDKLTALEVTSDVFGERALEAAGVLTAALSRVVAAIEATEARDRQRAEEAAEQQRRDEEVAANLRLTRAKCARGVEMFELLKNVLPDLENVESPYLPDIRLLIAEIEGAAQ